MSSRGREGSRQSMLLDEGPYFFKIVYSPVSQGLRIPTGFVEEHEINKRVVLKVRTGDSWPIELRRTDDGYWLDKGWQEFAAFYAIEIRQFLTFRYEGNSQFFVVIFNPSGKEIQEYPGKSKHEPDDDDDDDDYSLSVEILAEKPESSRPTGRRRKTEPSRKEVFVESQEQEPEVSLEILSVKIEPEDVANFRRSRLQESIREEQDSGTGKPCTIPELDKENFLSYKRAKTFASNKSVFIGFMQPSYVSKKNYMNFPWSFFQGFIPRTRKKFDVELHVPGLMEVWPLTLKCTYGPRYKKVKTRGPGWKRFVLDNKLVFGDVCVFEWAKAASLTLNLMIFRNSS